MLVPSAKSSATTSKLIASSTIPIQLHSLRAYELNNTMRADIQILFFNRCAKVGSESMIGLLQMLERRNNFTVDHLGPHKPTQRTMRPRDQRRVADYVYRLGADSVYIEHVNWIDFHDYGFPKPIYINLVRDPVERVISWFYYARSSLKNAKEFRRFPDHELKPAAWFKKDFNECVRSGDPECQYVPFAVRDFMGNYKRQSLFFCGHTEDCLPFDSPLAIQIAKRRVESEYAVVGTWEESNITLAVLESYVPRFFSGATTLFHTNRAAISNRNRNNRKPHIDADVREMIKRNFTHEYDFYHFCRQRLFKQYIAARRAQFPDVN